MRPAVLTMAVLLGIATLGGAAQAQATPTVSATVVIESGRTVLVGGKRHHHHAFQRGHARHWHKGFTNHHKGWRAAPHKRKVLTRHHKRWHHGHHHRPVWVKRFHKAPVVIVRPAPGRWFGHRHLPARPLIRNGSFARGPFHW
jgi:hypothetical protein